MRPKTLLAKSLASTNTTTVGILLAVVAVLQVAIALLDGDASTSPDWEKVAMEVIAAFGFLFARDSDKRSEDVGA